MEMQHKQLDWIPYQIAQAVGGSILFISIILYAISISLILLSLLQKVRKNILVGEVADAAEKTPLVFENWKLWLGITAALILFAYTIPIMDIIQNAPVGSKGYKFW